MRRTDDGAALAKAPKLLGCSAPNWTRSLCLLGAFALAFLPLTPTFADDLPIGSAPEPQDAVPEPPPPEPVEEDSPIFFSEDLPVEEETIIYVVDRSSSMSLPIDPYIGLDGNVVSNGTRLDYVKTELKRSVNSLSASFSFNIVIYDECLEQWRTARQTATLQKKAEAMAWIDAIQPWGWTNTGGAACLALADAGNKTVLLLSDGAPNFLDCAQSYVADFETHRSLIRQANAQDATVHTFGIGLDQETESFMIRVAQDNGGTFRKVD